MLDITKYEALKIGLENPHEFIEDGKVTSLIKTVLPHQEQYLNEHGSSVHYYLLEEIENLILLSLQDIINGVSSDKENAERAASILKESEALMKAVNEESKKA